MFDLAMVSGKIHLFQGIYIMQTFVCFRFDRFSQKLTVNVYKDADVTSQKRHVC